MFNITHSENHWSNMKEFEFVKATSAFCQKDPQKTENKLFPDSSNNHQRGHRKAN